MAGLTCWSQRGCDEELWSRCPHAVSSTDGLCPAQCNYTQCFRPEHVLATGLDLLDAQVDRAATVKEACWYCEFFIKHGPRLAGI